MHWLSGFAWHLPFRSPWQPIALQRPPSSPRVPRITGISAGQARTSTQRALPIADRPVEEVQPPFLMELARPRKMRLELPFNGRNGDPGI
jgi:hypothetical protein